MIGKKAKVQEINKEVKGMSLNKASTKELIEELERRNRFKKIKVEPYEKIEVGGFVVNGPAMVLINKY